MWTVGKEKKMFNQSKYSNNGGKQRVSGGFKQGNMNEFIFAGGKKKRKIVKRKK